MFNLYDVEEIILGMAEIVKENRTLRNELNKAKEYEKKYYNLLDKSVDHATRSTEMILEAIIVGSLSN
jgi:hypothetical protein